MTAQPLVTSQRDLLARMLHDARHVLDGTMADVTQQQADFIPPGIANPLGATFAHVACSEDFVVQGMFRQAAPLLAGAWLGRTGLSEPMPLPGPAWVEYGPWTRRVTVDLAALRVYARAVADETDAWLAGLSEEDLARPMDLSAAGFGVHTRGSAIATLVVHHLATETGEIAVLKGLQGARGYPM
jgi:hypothetical protein